SAKVEVPEEATRRVLDATLQSYERIAPHITPATPIAARELLERVLVFSIPFDGLCPVTELGLVGKLRANGDLFQCGQLSAVDPARRRERGLRDDELVRNTLVSPDALTRHVRGSTKLASYNVCPSCREFLANTRFLRFETLSAT